MQLFGLRNEGYAGTRHNVGEAFVDYAHNKLKDLSLAHVSGWKTDKKAMCEVSTATVPVLSLLPPQLSPPSPTSAQTKANSAKKPAPTSNLLSLAGVNVELVLCKPTGFINESGQPVRAAVGVLKPASWCVFHDGMLLLTVYC